MSTAPFLYKGSSSFCFFSIFQDLGLRHPITFHSKTESPNISKVFIPWTISPPRCSFPWRSRGTWRPSSHSWIWAGACGPEGSRHPAGTQHLKPGWEKSVHLVECHRSPNYRKEKTDEADVQTGSKRTRQTHRETWTQVDRHKDKLTGRCNSSPLIVWEGKQMQGGGLCRTPEKSGKEGCVVPKKSVTLLDTFLLIYSIKTYRSFMGTMITMIRNRTTAA